MVAGIVCREGQPGCSYEEDTPHRGKGRKKGGGFIKRKRWGRRRGGEEAALQSDEGLIGMEDKFAVKVRCLAP